MQGDERDYWEAGALHVRGYVFLYNAGVVHLKVSKTLTAAMRSMVGNGAFTMLPLEVWCAAGGKVARDAVEAACKISNLQGHQLEFAAQQAALAAPVCNMKSLEEMERKEQGEDGWRAAATVRVVQALCGVDSVSAIARALPGIAPSAVIGVSHITTVRMTGGFSSIMALGGGKAEKKLAVSVREGGTEKSMSTEMPEALWAVSALLVAAVASEGSDTGGDAAAAEEGAAPAAAATSTAYFVLLVQHTKTTPERLGELLRGSLPPRRVLQGTAVYEACLLQHIAGVVQQHLGAAQAECSAAVERTRQHTAELQKKAEACAEAMAQIATIDSDSDSDAEDGDDSSIMAKMLRQAPRGAGRGQKRARGLASPAAAAGADGGSAKKPALQAAALGSPGHEMAPVNVPAQASAGAVARVGKRAARNKGKAAAPDAPAGGK